MRNSIQNRTSAVCDKSMKSKYLQIPSNGHVFECFRGYCCQLQSKQLTKHNREKKHSTSCFGNS